MENIKTQTLNMQTMINTQMAVEMLQKGNERFLENKQLPREFDKQVAQTAKGQYPFAIVLSCIDSRVPT